MVTEPTGVGAEPLSSAWFSLQPGQFHRRQCSRQPALPRPGALHSRLPRVAQVSADCELRSGSGRAGAPQLGQVQLGCRPRSPFTTPQAEQVLLLGNHWSASKMRVPYQLALYRIWSSRLDIAASASALDCSPAFSMPDTLRVSMPEGVVLTN